MSKHYLNLKPWQVKAAIDGRLAAVWVKMRDQPDGVDGDGPYHLGPNTINFTYRNPTARYHFSCPLGVPGDVIVCKNHGITLINDGVEVRRVQELSVADYQLMGVPGECRHGTLGEAINMETLWQDTVIADHGHRCWDENHYGWLVKFK